MMKTLVSWSGGKDSCYALMLAMQQGYQPGVMLNVMNESGQRSRSHGLPEWLLYKQAAAMGWPLRLIASSWNDYEKNFINALQELKQQFALSHAVFGDIDLQAHRDWEEKVTAAAGLVPLLPLWQQDRKTLLLQMLDAGIETMIISCNSVMGPSYTGRILSAEIIPELEALGIDPCGENGEFHTVVLHCPLFSEKIEVQPIGIQEHEGYWFLELANP